MPNPVILGEATVNRMIMDSAFYTALPEYEPVRTKLAAMKAAMSAPQTGCSSCRRRKAIRSLYSDFVAVTNSLSPDGLLRLKQYLGVDRIMYNRIDNTGAVRLQQV